VENLPAESAVSMTGLLYACSGCGGAFELLTRVGPRQICADCWRKAGSPFPRVQLSAVQLADHVAAIERRMMQHGGAFASAVKNGKT
jgi:hypothetical protein